VPNRHHPVRLTSGHTQNKPKNSGIFLDAKKQPSTHHDLPRNSPQLHHKNTTIKHPFSQKPLKKRPSTTHKKNAPRQKAEPHPFEKLNRNRLTRQRE
jgi:hypothetical protein